MSSITHWTTKKLKEVLNNPYCVSNIGTDFEYVKKELQAELWRRLEKASNKRTSELEALYNMEGDK
jgi:hypothetical protein